MFAVPPLADLSAPSRRLFRDEWAALSTCRPNILVLAADLAAEVFVQELTKLLRPPLHYWNGASSLSWSGNDVGSLVVRDVAALDAVEQRDLYRWLNQRASERIQVLSVTAVPLFPLVERGAFLDTLYYRLNVLHLIHPVALG